jgi:hypothetical protein
MWGRRIHPIWLAALLLAPSCAAVVQSPADRNAALVEAWKGETDPVRRAKLFPRLGDAQLAEIQRLANGEDFIKAGAGLEEYRDEVKATFQGLKDTGVDAERKPGGFKELQIHLRRALKQIDDIVRRAPEGPRVPLQVARQEIGQVNRELIDLLFPRQPGKGPGKGKQKE